MTSIVDKIAYSLSAQSRKKKFSQFLQEIIPQKEERILDVGVNTTEYSDTDNYLETSYSHPEKITAIGLGDMSMFAKHYPLVHAISADGLDLPFEDDAFDIAYSNAVIEHVGDHEKQLQFLKELVRVAKRGYLTTPNRLFLVEVHTRVPFLHLILSKKYFDTFLDWIGKSWATGDYMRLLSEQELRLLFAQSGITEYSLIKNRFLLLPMTFTVLWKK